MFCAGASEITLSEWSSVFAQNALGVDKFIGDLFGPCAFALFMGLGRILFGLFSTKLSIRKALIANNILCTLCYLTVGLCDIPFLSLISCALCGFSVSLSWPGTYSLASSYFGKANTIIFSVFALCGDFGCSTGPWLLGFVADNISFKSGFVVSSLFPLIMIFVALFLLEEKDCVTQ
jgi:fucose permease